MTYQSRGRAPNVSQYLADLNTINPSLSSPETVFDENSVGEDHFSLFATAQFFDFDKAVGEMDGGNNDSSLDQGRDGTGVKDESGNMDFLMNADFNFDYLPVLGEDFSSFQQSANQGRRQQPSLQQQHTPQTPSVPSHSHSSQSSQQASPPQPQLKSNADEDVSLEEASRVAAEEDKRRRNTAASARFRIKKKQREQALERHAKELEAKCATLESKINQLEMENKWLKNLVVEKNTGSAKEGIEGVLKGGFTTTAGASSSTKEIKDGVGVKTE